MQASLKIIVDDESQVLGAMSFLRSAPCLYLDTEGKEIGTTEGELTLICIGAFVGQTLLVFVFDVGPNKPSLSKAEIAPLLDLLASPDIPKVMWDSRCDYLEIMDKYKVGIQAILDLQIAELVSRKQVRRETGRQTKDRLSTRFGYRNLREHPVVFKDIQIVIGMQKCLEETSLGVTGKDPEVEEMHKKQGSDIWLPRPLPKKLLDYAAGDITRLAALHCHFCAVGWITTQNNKALMEKSLRYARTQIERGRQDKKYPFRSCAILPQGTLTPLGKRTIQCVGCKRMLNANCYIRHPKESPTPLRRQHCTVCFAIGFFHKSTSLREQVDVWVEV